MKITLPVRVISEANGRDHPMAKARRTKKQRIVACMHVRAFQGLPQLVASGGPIVVTLTRLMAKGQKQFDDDNLSSAFKAVRDGCADAMGLNDRDKRIAWRYAQERANGFGIRVEIAGA